METLTKEKAIELNGKRIKLKAKIQMDWVMLEINGNRNIFVDERDGVVWFFKSTRSRSGNTFGNLINPMYELI